MTAPAATPPPRRRRVSLQIKLAVVLLLIVMTPLIWSAYLIDQIGKVAANFGAAEAAAREDSMRRAEDAYLEAFETTKRWHAEVATRLASRPDLAALDPTAPLDRILDAEQGLVEIALIDHDGHVVASRSRPLPERWGKWGVVDNHVDHPLPGGATLALNFAVPDLQPHYKALQQSRAVVEEAQRVRTALPYGLKLSFLIGMGVAGVLAIALGVLASRVITSRIGLLVTAARKISGGQLDARAGLRGNDELAELGASFDTMLDDLDRQRQQIEYLQRIGAWQDVARKLAHEIKNPLTPIQLAVQQCVSAYKGDDERYRKLLADTGEIVEEEIAGLRRLVDTFRTLGALPRVEAQPLDLREVVEELHLDAQLAERLRIEPPADDVTVRADKLLLKRLLTNLCENGVHAGEGAGNPGDVVVGWALASGGRAVAITVDDHGPGVRAEARERIFEPYVTTKATGTGLGLAIAKKIALEHGGDLEIAETPAPTGGARFVVTLPLGDAAA